MKDEILKLARSMNFLITKQGVASLTEEHLEAFYKAAYNKAIEDAAKELGFWVYTDGQCMEAVRSLEMK